MSDDVTHVVHIGIRKTGTTTLQSHFFPNLDGWAYLGRGSPRFAELHRLMNDLVRAREDEWSRFPLAELIEASGRGRTGLVVSREHFSDAHLKGRTARRFHTVCPDAKIVIGIRSQATAFQSGYSQHVKNGGSMRFGDWTAAVSDAEWLRGDVIIQCYQELFGVDAVKVLPYELLVRDERRYLGELLAFMDPSASLPPDRPSLPRANTALSDPTVAALRQVNRALFRSERTARTPFRHVRIRPRLVRVAEAVDRSLPSRWRARPLAVVDPALLERYEDTNARIEALTGLSLAQYGYPLPGTRYTSGSR